MPSNSVYFDLKKCQFFIAVPANQGGPPPSSLEQPQKINTKPAEAPRPGAPGPPGPAPSGPESSSTPGTTLS